MPSPGNLLWQSSPTLSTPGIHSIVTGGSWGFISILIAWMIWHEGWREYQMALAEESFSRWT